MLHQGGGQIKGALSVTSSNGPGGEVTDSDLQTIGLVLVKQIGVSFLTCSLFQANSIPKRGLLDQSWSSQEGHLPEG